MAGFWEQDAVVTPQGGPQPVFTAPDPRGAAADARADISTQVQLENLRMKQEEAAQKEQERIEREAAERTGITDSVAQMRSVVDAARRAKDLSKGWFATGFGAETAKGMGGTTATDVASLLETIASNTAFDRLQRMREASPTGGALGAVSERELTLLQSSISSLNQAQSDEQFRASMDRVIDAYQRVIDRLDPPQQDGTRQPAMVGDVPRGTEVELNVDRWGQDGFDRNAALLDIYGVTPNQEATITAFWNANRGNAGLTVEGARQFYQQQGLPLPTDADLQAAIDGAKAGHAFGGFDTGLAEQAWKRRIEEEAARRGQMGAIDLAGQGLQAGLGDEAAGVGGAISALMTGGNPGEAYRFENELRDYQLEQARKASGIGGTAAEIAGNAASGGWAFRIPSSAQAAVREGMLAGAVPGFGYGEGTEESLAGAGMGAAAGGIISRIFAGRKPPAAPTGGSPVIQAADDLNAQFGTNIRPLPADVAGATTRRATGATAQMPLGASPIINASRAVNDQGEAARNAIAAQVGKPQELEAAGQRALSGAQKWMKSTGTKVNTLYTRARKLSEGVAVPLTNARRVLDEHIAELESTPGGAQGVAELRALRDEIGEDYTVDAIKRMRTTLRDRFIGDGIRKSDIERRVGQVIDAAEQDVADGLIAAGRPEAADAWTKAAAAARERLQVIDNVLAPIIGKRSDAPKSGEQIMAAIGRMSKGDNAKLAQFIKALPAEEAGTVRATVIGRLGTTNADATDFTLAKFLTQWEKMTPGAKRTLFGGELTEALDKLATVAGGSKEAQRFANFSNTGSTIGLLATGGMGASAFANPVLAVAGLAGQYGMGRLLASPAFARWLARMPKNPQAAQKHVEGLSRIASSESAIAADAIGLQRQLSEFFQAGSGQLPLAAQPVPLGQPTGSPETAGAAR